jgi:predicted HTH domain antitoxin
MQIVIDMPDRYLLNVNAEEMAKQVKPYTALVMFQSGQISAGAACELAGVDRYSFLAACKKHSIPAIDYEEDEIEMELERLSRRES